MLTLPSLLILEWTRELVLAPTYSLQLAISTAVHVYEDFYTDAAAFRSHAEEQLQSIIYNISNTCSFCLKITIKKTIIMSHGTQAAKIILSDEALETVENFACLCSITTKNFTIDKDLYTQLDNAVTPFRILSQRA